MKYAVLFLISFIIGIPAVWGQAENIPLNNEVYEAIKEWSVRGLIPLYHDANPNLSRLEVERILRQVNERDPAFSETDLSRLEKFRAEFFPEVLKTEKAWELFDFNKPVIRIATEFYSDKTKNCYTYRDEYVTLYSEGVGYFTFAGEVDQKINRQAGLYYGGFRFMGTAFKNWGYNLTVLKGGANGSHPLHLAVDPRLTYSFKYNENLEPVKNYDFTQGYIQYLAEPAPNAFFGVQLGRETTRFGYGYTNSLMMSGEQPDMDFIKFRVNYGYFSLTSLHASTVGEYHTDRSLNYTKYLALHRVGLSFPGLFDLGAGEATIYSRQLDLAYVTPLSFFKFLELSLQDRDNNLFFVDFQSHFIPGFEIQCTFMMDEDILSNLEDLNRFSNKIAAQTGFWWSRPAGIQDLSLIMEYTWIRPYVYSHLIKENNYTAYGYPIGHRIGPNSDELMTRLVYYFSGRVKLTAEHRLQRSGENRYDSDGILIENAGGNIFEPVRETDSRKAYFLDGERHQKNRVILDLRYEFSRNNYLNLVYDLTGDYNQSAKKTTSYSFSYLRYTIEY
ncbi:MAG: capsule assembly Wzi family protein [Bacteroidetes bacterium]|nr:capsule assembly Wzi family protein [Bacteroidota bacterium]